MTRWRWPIEPTRTNSAWFSLGCSPWLHGVLALALTLRGADQQCRVGSGKTAAENERDVAARNLRRSGNAQTLASRIEIAQCRHAGNDAFAQGGERDDGFDDACRGDEMTGRPFERGHRRRFLSVAEAGSNRRRFRSIRLTGAVAVRDDHADVARRKSRVVERARDGACGAVAVVTNGEQAGRLGRIAAAEDLPQHCRVT